MARDAFECLSDHPNWVKCFHRGALQRGEKYAEEGRAELEAVDTQLISAPCAGSRGQRSTPSRPPTSTAPALINGPITTLTPVTYR